MAKGFEVVVWVYVPVETEAEARAVVDKWLDKTVDTNDKIADALIQTVEESSVGHSLG